MSKAPRYPGDGRAEFAAIEREVLGLAARLDKDPDLVRGGAAVRLRMAAELRRAFAAMKAEMAPRPGNTTTTTTATTTRGNTTAVPEPYRRR